MPDKPAKAMASRWAVEIAGHPSTITRLETHLNNSLLSESDTFISRLRDVAVVRTQLWDKVREPSFVGQLAEAELAFLQGVAKLGGGASPLGVGTVFELDEQDSISKQSRESINSVYVLSRDAESTAVFRNRMDVARRHEALRGAVIELAGSSDWIKIYKAVEYLEDYHGGEKHLLEAFPDKKTAIKRIKRTAQSVRHRSGAIDTVSSPYKLGDAEAVLQSLLNRIIATVSPQVSAPARRPYRVVTRAYPPGQVIGLRPLILVNGEASEVAFVGDTLTTV